MPIKNASIAASARIAFPDLVNVYGCRIGADSRVGPFVEIQKGVTVGQRCKISSHSFLCEGVTLMDDVFVGHGVMFTNDRYPAACNADGTPKGDGDWTLAPILVGRGAAIGSNATILAGVTIGEGALVGAGAVITRVVPDFAIVTGVPARVTGDARRRTTGGDGCRSRTQLHSRHNVRFEETLS